MSALGFSTNSDLQYAVYNVLDLFKDIWKALALTVLPSSGKVSLPNENRGGEVRLVGISQDCVLCKTFTQTLGEKDVGQRQS